MYLCTKLIMMNDLNINKHQRAPKTWQRKIRTNQHPSPTFLTSKFGINYSMYILVLTCLQTRCNIFCCVCYIVNSYCMKLNIHCTVCNTRITLRYVYRKTTSFGVENSVTCLGVENSLFHAGKSTFNCKV